MASKKVQITKTSYRYKKSGGMKQGATPKTRKKKR